MIHRTLKSLALASAMAVFASPVFAQSFDDLFKNRSGGAAAFQQTLPQFGNRARLGGQQLSGARKDAFAGLGGIETWLFVFRS